MPDMNELHNMSEIENLMKMMFDDESKIVDEEVQKQLENIKLIEAAFEEREKKGYTSPFVGTEGILSDQGDGLVNIAKNSEEHMQFIEDADERIEQLANLDREEKIRLEKEVISSAMSERVLRAAGVYTDIQKLERVMQAIEESELKLKMARGTIAALKKKLSDRL